MRRGLLVAALALIVLAAGAPARADVDVTSGSFGINLTGTGDGRWRVIVEHFADESRNGVRVRQLGTGDPRISSNNRLSPRCCSSREAAGKATTR